MMEAVRDKMPVVLVMVWSTPRQLQSIEWAVAVLDDSGKVELRGRESLWEQSLPPSTCRRTSSRSTVASRMVPPLSHASRTPPRVCDGNPGLFDLAGSEQAQPI